MEQYLFKSTMNINECVRITSMVIGHMFFLLTLNRRFPIQKWCMKNIFQNPSGKLCKKVSIPREWKLRQHNSWWKFQSVRSFFRGSRSQLFFSISIPKYFAKYKWWKGLSFSKNADYERYNKEALHRRCFHVNNMKFPRIAF